MFDVITPTQMKELEALAFSSGIKSIDLMEKAAECVADELIKLIGGVCEKQVVFFCGKGNNGGDGLAAARIFHKLGGQSFVVMQGEPKTEDALLNFQRLIECNIPVSDSLPEGITFDGAVDALLGIGLSGPLSDELKWTIKTINHLNLPMLSVDISSGMDALTGNCQGGCIRADRTLTFQYPKPGHFLTLERESVGELVTADIGLTAHAADFNLISSLQADDLIACLPRRVHSAHKGGNGRVLMYCGSLGMAGAAAMAALGCMRAGAGLTYITCEENIIPILQVLAPNAQCLPIDKVLGEVPKHDVFLAGCGLGQEKQVWQNILKIYSPDVPTVFDADALNLLAASPIRLSQKTVMTPHIGEAARLLGLKPMQVADDMLSSSQELADRYGAVVLLKSHCSVIRSQKKVSLNTLTAPVLAKGGSGDALAGMVAGLLAQGLPPFDAARTASLWLSKTALSAQEEGGLYSPLTADILALMGKASI